MQEKVNKNKQIIIICFRLVVEHLISHKQLNNIPISFLNNTIQWSVQIQLLAAFPQRVCTLHHFLH